MTVGKSVGNYRQMCFAAEAEAAGASGSWCRCGIQIHAGSMIVFGRLDMALSAMTLRARTPLPRSALVVLASTIAGDTAVVFAVVGVAVAVPVGCQGRDWRIGGMCVKSHRRGVSCSCKSFPRRLPFESNPPGLDLAYESSYQGAVLCVHL